MQLIGPLANPERAYKSFLEYVGRFKRKIFTIKDLYTQFWRNEEEESLRDIHK